MPELSILIPTFNRPDALAKTLLHVRAQHFQDYEIVVIDDGSERQLTAEVCARYATRYFRLESNQGIVAAHNFGVEKCSGRYILSLDDDSWPVAATGLAECVAFLNANPSIAVLALNIQVRGLSPQWPQTLKPFKPPYYGGCGAVFRRSSILQTGANINEFRRQGEESDRSLRIYSAGLPIVALPSVVVRHEVSELNRNRRRNLTYEALNYLTRELVRAPLILLPFGVLRALAFAAIHRRSLDAREYFIGLRNAQSGPVGLMFKYRKPAPLWKYVQWQVQRYLYNDGRLAIESYSRRYAWQAPRER